MENGRRKPGDTTRINTKYNNNTPANPTYSSHTIQTKTTHTPRTHIINKYIKKIECDTMRCVDRGEYTNCLRCKVEIRERAQMWCEKYASNN